MATTGMQLLLMSNRGKGRGFFQSSIQMGLINEDLYTAPNGITLANTFVKLGTDMVHFTVNNADGTYSASTTMSIFRDADAYKADLRPLESRSVCYPVPDPSPVYQLLYGSAKVSEGWANTQQHP